MTIARSLLNNGTFNVDGIPQDTLPPVPEGAKRYNVMLHKVGGKWNEFVMGYVVTHLAIDEWCEMHKYKLVNLYLGTRPARQGEKTDLF